jgi:hypothetical protein
VDIQGSEAEFLPGARDTLSRAIIDYLFVSTHSQLLHQHIVSRLVDIGYRVDVSSDFDNDTTSFDGFVFASNPQAKRIFSEFPYLGRTSINASRPDQLVQAIEKARESAL